MMQSDPQKIRRMTDTEKLLDLAETRKIRYKYANTVLWLFVGWVIAVTALLFLHGYSNSFILPDNVLIGLSASAAANSAGLAGAVIRYLWKDAGPGA